jgi:hypothetical protein
MKACTLCQIAEELRGQYLLTYTPDLVDKEGGFHKIALKANKDDLTVVTRDGYYAPGGRFKVGECFGRELRIVISQVSKSRPEAPNLLR